MSKIKLDISDTFISIIRVNLYLLGFCSTLKKEAACPSRI
jgi:hypothetical protein